MAVGDTGTWPQTVALFTVNHLPRAGTITTWTARGGFTPRPVRSSGWRQTGSTWSRMERKFGISLELQYPEGGLLLSYDVILKYQCNSLSRMIWNLNAKVERLMCLIHVKCLALYRCSYDYLNVYDGSNTGAKLIDKFCGHRTLNILSSGQNLYLEFITDDSERLRGFELSYKFVYASGKCQIVRIKYQYMTKRLLYTLKLIETLSLRNVWMIFIWLRYLRGKRFSVP